MYLVTKRGLGAVGGLGALAVLTVVAVKGRQRDQDKALQAQRLVSQLDAAIDEVSLVAKRPEFESLLESCLGAKKAVELLSGMDFSDRALLDYGGLQERVVSIFETAQHELLKSLRDANFAGCHDDMAELYRNLAVVSANGATLAYGVKQRVGSDLEALYVTQASLELVMNHLTPEVSQHP